MTAEPGPGYRRSGPGFRARLTFGLVVAAVAPVAGFGVVVLVITGGTAADETLVRVLLLAVAIAVVFAVLLAAVLAADLSRPLREIASAVERAMPEQVAGVFILQRSVPGFRQCGVGSILIGTPQLL